MAGYVDMREAAASRAGLHRDASLSMSGSDDSPPDTSSPVLAAVTTMDGKEKKRFPATTTRTPLSTSSSAPARTPADSKAPAGASLVLYEGWLTKKGGFVPTWKRRYFRLHTSHFAYYHNPGIVVCWVQCWCWSCGVGR